MPSFIRLVQCVRRYLDSGQYLHLINVKLPLFHAKPMLKPEQGGKYSSSIIYYALYYNWRNAGWPLTDHG
jgi:xenotropic and polytropic retrovirus receptor 1